MATYKLSSRSQFLSTWMSANEKKKRNRSSKLCALSDHNISYFGLILGNIWIKNDMQDLL